ncbi:hypothetical protein BC828DRAFT_378298 [Blastocladiella britannica]|nr:hypothetical protein BC828DRAFT_378298 [Blastocladiella britannica]
MPIVDRPPRNPGRSVQSPYMIAIGRPAYTALMRFTSRAIDERPPRSDRYR